MTLAQNKGIQAINDVPELIEEIRNQDRTGMILLVKPESISHPLRDFPYAHVGATSYHDETLD